MGVARLLAKGWIVFCLFAAAHAINIAVLRGLGPVDALESTVVPALLFAAMGLLFIGGFGASAAHGVPLLARFKLAHLVPGFNEVVFLAFAGLSFIDQVLVAPNLMSTNVADALGRAIAWAVPGQQALVDALGPCGLDGGRILASSFTWLLAIIYLASAVSRLKLAAGIIRLERSLRPQTLGPLALAFVLGVAAIIGVQLLYIGSAFPWLSCSAFTDITGALLIGLAPLMLSYLIVAALAATMATGPE